MNKIFIAYADEKMSYSLQRIGREASRLHFFDEIRLWTPQMLPDEFRNIELMQYPYGGGYWAWKPYIIHRTLQESGDNTIVCYADAGCTLRRHPDWHKWENIMETSKTILFQYPDEMDIWEKFGSKSTKIKHWTKKQSILFYDNLTGGTQWRDQNKIWGGALWMRDQNNPILKQWLDITLNHPEIIKDASTDDEQFGFFAQHKHDQSLLTALSCIYPDACTILPAVAELNGADNAIEASRIRVKNATDHFIYRTKEYMRRTLGSEIFNKCKRIVTKFHGS